MNGSSHINKDQVPLRSWVVLMRGGAPVLDHSRWAVGYTEGHKATPAEAVEYAIQVNISMHEDLERQREKLLDMLKLISLSTE